MHYIKKGKEEGARIVFGGERVGDKGFYVQPTVFADVKDNMSIATDEVLDSINPDETFNSLFIWYILLAIYKRSTSPFFTGA